LTVTGRIGSSANRRMSKFDVLLGRMIFVKSFNVAGLLTYLRFLYPTFTLATALGDSEMRVVEFGACIVYRGILGIWFLSFFSIVDAGANTNSSNCAIVTRFVLDEMVGCVQMMACRNHAVGLC
jgi:hypothetical protein